MSLRPTARIATHLLLLSCLALLGGCGGGGSSSGSKNVRTITKISISPQNPTLAKGNTLQLTATAIYSDATHQDVTTSVAWKTNQAAVVAVNAIGSLSAVGVGAAQVAAQYQGVTGSDSVTVGPAALVSLTVNPGQSSLPIGESEQLTATGIFTDGSQQDLTQSANWNSSTSGIADVNAIGTTVAVSTGTATITATSGNLTGTALLTVTPAAAIALNIVPNTASMALGSSRQFQAIATFSDGTTQDMTGLVLWSSSEANVANVNSGGLAVAEQVGSTTISAQGNSLSAAASVSVIPLMTVNYFDLASAQKSGGDGTVRLVNPGLTGGTLCTMIYVFDENQELSECCGCTVSDSGLRTLSLSTDLTNNPLTGQKPRRGAIKVVPSDPTPNPQCDPGSLSPAGVILGWGSSVQTFPDGTFQVSETRFDQAPLSDGESNALVNECNFLRQLGSGQGICSCGSGD
jgi:uncharacterized protein YjdB